MAIFKQKYIESLEYDCIESYDDFVSYKFENLNPQQQRMACDQLLDKIKDIKNGKYDSVFEKEFHETISNGFNITDDGAKVIGFTPEEYVRFILEDEEHEGGALFLYDIKYTMDGDKPVVTLDIDNDYIWWQESD